MVCLSTYTDENQAVTKMQCTTLTLIHTYTCTARDTVTITHDYTTQYQIHYKYFHSPETHNYNKWLVEMTIPFSVAHVRRVA